MSTKKLLAIIILFIVTILIVTLFYKDYTSNNRIEVVLEKSTQNISPHTSLYICIKNYQKSIESAIITIQQNEKTTILTKEQFLNNNNKSDTHILNIPLKKAQLKNGPFKLTATIKFDSIFPFWKLKAIKKSWELIFDNQPPQVHIHSDIAYIHRGSATVFAYTISKPIKLTGIKIDEMYFPAFQQPNSMYYCFFPFPIEYSTTSFTPYIIAEDLAGNTTRVPLPIHAIPRNFKPDTLIINDQFLENTMPRFEQAIPDAPTHLDRYLKVNSTIRTDNEHTLIEMSKKTASTMLWSGKFSSLPRAVAKASFGEERTYSYHNKKIDQQTHMGLDLASVAHAPIPAANDGVVIFVGELGIFGNLIIIDHGLGLQTLYAHLSSFAVQEGQSVKKNDVIGYTGKTGLAGGDHLHFGITVGGIQVNPIDWLDPKWIKNTITDRLSLPSENKK